jgi:hypothetical protein
MLASEGVKLRRLKTSSRVEEKVLFGSLTPAIFSAKSRITMSEKPTPSPENVSKVSPSLGHLPEYQVSKFI